MGQMEMEFIFDIGKKNSILAKVTQVSDVAHGPLVICFASFEIPKTYQPAREKNKQEKITKSM
jgi:hypothetical protein